MVEGRPERLAEIPRRLAAVRAFAALPEAASLAAANKRVGNILKKSDAGLSNVVDAALLKEPAELALHAALCSVGPKADAAFEAGDHTGSLQALSALKAPVDAFFDGVMVNADDPALKANRLALDAGWNEELLALELAELSANGYDLSLLGFDEGELEGLLAEGLGNDQDAPAPSNAKPNARLRPACSVR